MLDPVDQITHSESDETTRSMTYLNIASVFYAAIRILPRIQKLVDEKSGWA